jgi:4-amino-4-deoxy-L-arabinose transferase-like glycosyltransferase
VKTTKKLSFNAVATISIIACYCYYVFLSVQWTTISSTDELGYLSVSWQMFVSHNYLIPMQNMVPYPHKPPLLFWYIIAAWHLFGASATVARVALSLFPLGCLFLTAKLTKQLFPKNKVMPFVAACVLFISMECFYLMAGLVHFDFMVCFFSLLIMYSSIRLFCQTRHKRLYQLILLIAPTLAVLTKGPVFFLYVFPFLFSCFLIYKDSRQQYQVKRLFLAFFLILIGSFLSLIWVIPACLAGGDAYSHFLLLGNSVGRATGKSVHSKPIWYYLQNLLGYLFPWTLFVIFGFKRIHLNANFWKLAIGIIIILGAFSLIAQKGGRYLIPLFPLLSIAISYILCQYNNPNRVRWIAAAIFFVLSIAIASVLIFLYVNQELLSETLQHIHYGALAAITIFGFLCFLFFSLVKFNSLRNFHLCFLWAFVIYMSSLYITYLTNNNSYQGIIIGKKTQRKETQGYSIIYPGMLGRSQLDLYSHSITPIFSGLDAQSNQEWIKGHTKYCVISKKEAAGESSKNIKDFLRNYKPRSYEIECRDNSQETTA